MKQKRFWLAFDLVVFSSVLAGATGVVYLLIRSTPDGVVELHTNDKGEMWPEIIYFSIMVVLGFFRSIFLILKEFVGGKLWRRNSKRKSIWTHHLNRR